MEPLERDGVFGAVVVIGLLTLVFGLRHGHAEDAATVDGRPVRISPAVPLGGAGGTQQESASNADMDPIPGLDNPTRARGDDLAPISGGGASVWQVVEVDTRTVQLDLLGQGDTADLRTLGAARAWAEDQGRVLVMATNAGIFEPGLSPTGLFVSGGEVASPLNRQPGRGNFFLEPNGVFAVDGAGRARVLSTEKHAAREMVGGVVLATQSGPLVLDEGAVHPRFQAGSSNLRVRSGVGVSRADPHRVFFAISTVPVRFHDMATFFRDDLGCDQALYLDGVISGMVGPSVSASVAAPGPFAGLLVATIAP